MTALADDHYAVDVTKADELIGWKPRHRFELELPGIVEELLQDPPGWYRRNGVQLAASLQEASGVPDLKAVRQQHAERYSVEIRDNRWPHFVNIALGSWLFTQPVLLNVQERWLFWSEMALGGLLMLFASLALSERGTWACWVCAAIGTVVMAVPFLFHTTNAAAHASDSLLG
jgi:hypothetical protein